MLLNSMINKKTTCSTYLVQWYMVFECKWVKLAINIINWMQNKSSAAKSHYLTPSTRAYRSIRYNITQTSGFHPNSTSFIDKSTSSPVKDAGKTYAPTWRKPSSYSTHKNSTKRTQFVENAEDVEAVDLKVGYLQTWEKLLSQQDRLKEERRDRINTMRVQLPSIIDFQPSKFTSLDPLFLPFEHIQKGIDELKQQLPQPKVEMAQIHHDMVNFKNKIMAQLQETEKFGLQEFDKLRRMLRTDKVQCQEVQLRFKRQCQQLKDIDADYKQNFESTKPRLDDLQTEIFSCRPFDLTRNELLDEQFPQEYF